MQVYLGIEIGLAPGDGALGELQLCTWDPKSGTVFENLECAKYYPLLEDPNDKGVYIAQTVRLKDQDDLQRVKLLMNPIPFRFGELRHIIRMRALKRGLLHSYDEDNRATTYYKYEFKPSEEMIAELHICKGGLAQCLTGCKKTANQILEEMHRTTIPGMNRILVVLDEKGEKIMSCFVDGILYIDQDTHKVKTAR